MCSPRRSRRWRPPPMAERPPLAERPVAPRRRRRRWPPVVVLLLALPTALLPLAAQAHRLNVFARANGAAIEGLVYHQGMVPVRATPVAVLDPDGAILTTVVTDDQGRFAFPAARRVDHRLVVDLGDGHRAEFVVPAAQLAQSLPPPSPPEPSLPADAHAGGATGNVGQAMPPAEPEAFEALVDAAVARHVGPLREQIAAYEDRVRWRDMLGGIGYIVGMTGLAFYFLARRHGERRER